MKYIFLYVCYFNKKYYKRNMWNQSCRYLRNSFLWKNIIFVYPNLIKSNSLGFMWPWYTVSICFLHLLWGWPHWGSVEVMIFYSMPGNHIALNTLEKWICNLFLYIYHLQNGKHRSPTAPSMAPSWVSAQSRTWRTKGTWFVAYIIMWLNHGNWSSS